MELPKALILDQIKEIFNLGVGHAAQEISELVQEEVLLSVPKATFQPLKEIAAQMGGEDRLVTAIYHQFQGGIQGQGFLLIDQSSSVQLIRHLLGESFDYQFMTETEKDTLVDLSSVIINGVLAALAGSLCLNLTSKLPRYLEGELGEVLYGVTNFQNVSEDFLMVKISIHIPQQSILSDMVFVQGDHDFNKILGPIEELIRTKLEG